MISKEVLTKYCLVGKHTSSSESLFFGWAYMGLFSKKEKADEQCKDENYFYVLVTLDENVEVFPGIVYPRKNK
jgi:hypothetical protein